MRSGQKDLAQVNRKTTKFGEMVKKQRGSATLRDFGGRAKVTMRWNLNPASVRDQVFELSINGEKAYIDLEQLLSYTRLI